MLVNVEVFEQAESRRSEFFLPESFRKPGFERRFAGFLLDDRDAAARTQNRTQASKVFDAIFNVVIRVDQQYEIETCGRQVGRGVGR